MFSKIVSFCLIVLSSAVSASIAFEVLKIYLSSMPMIVLFTLAVFYIGYNILQSATSLIDGFFEKSWLEREIEQFLYQCRSNGFELNEERKLIVMRQFSALQNQGKEGFIARVRRYGKQHKKLSNADKMTDTWDESLKKSPENILFLLSLNKALFISDLFRQAESRHAEWWFKLFGGFNALFNGITVVYLGLSRFSLLIPSMAVFLHSEIGLLLLLFAGITSSWVYTFGNAKKMFNIRGLFDQMSDMNCHMASYSWYDVGIVLCAGVMGFVSVIFNVRFAMTIISGSGHALPIADLLVSVGSSPWVAALSKFLMFKELGVFVCVACVFVNIPSYLYKSVQYFILNRLFKPVNNTSWYTRMGLWLGNNFVSILATAICLLIYYDSVLHFCLMTGASYIAAQCFSIGIAVVISSVLLAGFGGLFKSFELMINPIKFNLKSLSSPSVTPESLVKTAATPMNVKGHAAPLLNDDRYNSGSAGAYHH